VKRFLLALSVCAAALAQDNDPILRAMRDELKRSMTLKLQNLDTPYFIEYEVDDVRQFSSAATLGGLISSSESHFRVPRVNVRVGDYKFDNTDWVGSGYNFGPRYDIRLPLEDSYALLRQNLWLATDQAFKSALEAISRKRSALKNVAVSDAIPDFAPATPFKLIEPLRVTAPSSAGWADRMRSLSGVFVDYPKLKSSSTEVTVIDGGRYYMNTEGTEVRTADNMAIVRIRALAQAADGMTVRDARVFETRDPKRLPSEADMIRASKELAEEVTALTSAPVGENYSGPVLFEGVAGAQVFAEILGRNLALTRKPVLEPGSPGAASASELEGRQGARVLPDFINVVDDPTKKEFHGMPLVGSYEVDDEGVKAGPVTIVEKGTLKNFLMTRQPVRGFSGSNGHARLTGQFGAKTAVPGNLFVTASETAPVADLKKKLIEMCQQRQKPYGILVRKMDFPSSASVDEARRIIGGAGQGNGKATSLPLLVFRVYPDGHEERVRGIRFRGLNVRSLKDILAAGDDSNLFDYMENGAPFAIMGIGNEFSEVSVVAPSILIDDLEVLKIEDELPKLPVVPPPTLSRLSPR
jgi:TldD protein